MTRYLLRWMVILSGLFLLPVMLIRAQPYDDSELRALLTADDCVAPCFMGIQPGLTSADEAFALLDRHPWVAQLGGDYRHFYETTPNTDNSILEISTGWSWSTQTPAWVDTSRPAVMSIKGDLVTRLSFTTTLPLGELLLTFAAPDIHVIFKTDIYMIGQRRPETYNMGYTAECMVATSSHVPFRSNRYHTSIHILFFAPDSRTGQCKVTFE